jgi:hypothetical protein
LKKFKIFNIEVIMISPAPEWVGLAIFGVCVVAVIMWAVYWKHADFS